MTGWWNKVRQAFVVARDPDAGMVLLGGLGAQGVGQMWFKEEPKHREREGYDAAPIEKYPGDPLTAALVVENAKREAGTSPGCQHMDSHIHGHIKVILDAEYPGRFMDLTVRCKECDQLMTFCGARLDAAQQMVPGFSKWEFFPGGAVVSTDGYHLLVPMGDDKQVEQCHECGGSFAFPWFMKYLKATPS